MKKTNSMTDFEHQPVLLKSKKAKMMSSMRRTNSDQILYNQDFEEKSVTPIKFSDMKQNLASPKRKRITLIKRRVHRDGSVTLISTQKLPVGTTVE